MPQIRRTRTWCISCQDWTIHNIETCMTCKSTFQPYLLSEIPEEKLIEQRARYKAKRQKKHIALLNYDFSSPNYVITEADAGQVEMDKLNAQNRKMIADRISEIKDEYEEYVKLGRNDKCSCGSNKKYKQCHLLYFREYLNV